MASDSSDGVDYGKLADEIIDRAITTGMTRREVVSAIAGAGAAGTAVALASNRASAQDSLVIDGIDQIGRDGDRVQTLYVDNINNYTSSETFDSVTVNNNLDAGSINTGDLTVGSTVYYAADDAELDNTIASASNGDKIQLGGGVFAKDRTISNRLTVEGTRSGIGTDATQIEAE